jgi:hypothetical protein
MLFVLSIEVLNALITRAENDCLFWPIGHDGIALRASFYSNHMVIFIKSARQEMLLLLAILDAFEQASRLKTNLEKNKAIPIKCSAEGIQLALTTFGCSRESFPCRYLGIPLSLGKLVHSDEQPIIDEITNRITTWKGNLLNLAGRTTLIMATLLAIPVYVSIALFASRLGGLNALIGGAAHSFGLAPAVTGGK